jgi:2-aminobenzoylacetyl-CoA thioesterase
LVGGLPGFGLEFGHDKPLAAERNFWHNPKNLLPIRERLLEMNIYQPGKITERITLLGRSESCVYWVEDKGESVLLGGGMSYILSDLLQQIKAFELDEHRLRSICILHSHFDHCGVVPFLKQRWPWVRVTASARAKGLLEKPQILESIARMNQDAAAHAGLGPIPDMEAAFAGFAVEETLTDGDRLPCGALDLQVIETPGHSSCSISIYMADEKALFASDAAGLHKNGVNYPTPNSNFDLYQQSLAKLAGYDTDQILLEHYGAFTGEDALGYIACARQAADRMRELLEETYRRTRDVEKCTREVAAMFIKQSGDSFLTDEVHTMMAGQMVRYIAKVIDQGGYSSDVVTRE